MSLGVRGMKVTRSSILAYCGRAGRLLGRPRWLAGLFLLCALPTGLGIALLTPIDMFSDEFAHIGRADALRYGEILGVAAPGTPPGMARGFVIVNTGIFNVLLNKEFAAAYPDKPVPALARRETEAIKWDSRPAYSPSQMVEYLPIFYTPGALGLLAGEKLGFSPLDTVYLGRIAMLLAFIAMGTAALALARFGAALLFAILTLPAVLNLASSYNQDGMMLGACVLAAALLTRATAAPGRSWFAALALLIAVVCAKTPYAALLLFCLPPLCGPGFWRRAGFVLLGFVPPGLWLIHCIRAGFIAYGRTPYQPGPLWPGGHDIWLTTVQPHDNLLVLLAHPAQLIILPLVTLKAFWWATWPLLLGGMASGNLRIPAWEYPCLIFALAAAALEALSGRPAGWRVWDAGFAALALFAAFIGMEIALYVTFTSVGLPYIEGVSGRYFLPLMPFSVFLLGYAGSRLARLPHLAMGWFCLPAMAMALVNIYVLPALMFHVFRMPGP